MLFLLLLSSFTFMAAFMLIASETLWNAKPRAFTVWPFTEKVSKPWFKTWPRDMASQVLYPCFSVLSPAHLLMGKGASLKSPECQHPTKLEK